MISPESAYFRTRLTPDRRREKVWRHLSRYLARYIPPNGAVLELGAGYCYFINSVAAGRRVAVDNAPELLSFKAPEVEGVCQDALTYLREAAAEQFDFVLASNFFEHFDWPVLEEMIPLILRVMRPGGRLAAVQPNFRLVPKRYFDDYTHRTVFTDASLRDWLESAGFRILRVIPRFLPLTVKSAAGSLAFLVPLYLALPIKPLAGQMFILAERPAS